MPLKAPSIDNRRFADIVAEARTRIPRYAPEWTDLNDNEPGVALVQLFAWMTEMLIFRMEQVPEFNYIKFLQLLGIELRPAEPARAEVTFALADGQSQQTVVVPKETQIAAAGAIGDEPIVFETNESLIALAAQLQRLLVFDGFGFSDFSKQNLDATQPFPAFGESAREESALLLGLGYSAKFSGTPEIPKTQINLTFYVHTEGVRPEAVACGLSDSQVFPSARLIWEFWNAKEWAPLSLDKDTTLSLMRSGHVLLSTPEPGTIKKDKIGDAPEDLFWIRVRVEKAGYERPPILDAVRLNTIAVTQAQTQRDEVLGGSSGRPDQTFRVAFAPVLAGTLQLEVDEGQGFQQWEEVADFFASKSSDPHFVLNRTTGEVRFGDGEHHGRIPVGNVANPDGNIVARIYRYGGGKKGNVAAATLTNLSGGIAGVDANLITNLRAAVGGRDEETLDEAKDRAPQALKNKCRAVTAEDFTVLAQQAPGVKRAQALPLTDPGFPGVQVPGAVTVIIVSDSDVRKPLPSEGLIRTVCAYLDQRRLLTTELYVVPPIYHEVRVRTSVIALGNADLAEVKGGVEKDLLAYFHPLTGGEDGNGWEFGGDIFFSLVYRHVLAVPGVRRVDELLIEFDGEEQPFCQDVALEPGALVFSTAHEVVSIYETVE